MRRIVVLAAMLAVLGMVSQAAEAGNRGTGFRHISPHVGAKFHGFKLHRPGFVGKRNAFKFGKARLFKPRPFSRFGRSGLVLKFSDGAFALQFGHVPHFKPHPFGLGHGALCSNSAIGGISSYCVRAAWPSASPGSTSVPGTSRASTIARGAPSRAGMAPLPSRHRLKRF
jgi:hypothetical protein